MLTELVYYVVSGPTSPIARTAVVSGVFVLSVLGYWYASDARPVVGRIRPMLPITVVYLTLTGLGVVFRADATPLAGIDWLSVSTGAAAMALAHWGQWFINDLTDVETDQVSNADRPLSRGSLTERQALVSGLGLMTFGVLFAGAVRLEAAVALLAWIGVAMAYTLPPLRLKDGAFTGMLCFGLLGTVAVLFGSFLVAATPNRPVVELIAVLMVIIPLNSSYQDLPDETGDAEAGIDNFVVRYGSERVRTFLTVSFPVSFGFTAAFFGWFLAIPVFVGLGLAVSYLLLTWDGGDEIDPQISLVVSVYFVSLGVSGLVW